MTNPIKTGTMMIQGDVLLPSELSIDTDVYADGWRSVQTLDSYQLERGVAAAKWRLIFIAGRARSFQLGFGADARTRSCMRRFFAHARRVNLNCLEVTKLNRGHFLGIPYTSLEARFYQLQHGQDLQTGLERKAAQANTDWARG